MPGPKKVKCDLVSVVIEKGPLPRVGGWGKLQPWLWPTRIDSGIHPRREVLHEERTISTSPCVTAASPMISMAMVHALKYHSFGRLLGLAASVTMKFEMLMRVRVLLAPNRFESSRVG